MLAGTICVACRAVSTILFVCGALSTTRGLARPNVLFIAVDDLNDWVGFLEGHPQVKTPHMDRLAKRGVVFSNANCAAPLCGPSRAAIFSGKQPFHTGVVNNQQQIRKLYPDLVLLPQYFHAQGYRTLGAGKLMHRKFTDMYDETFYTEQRWSPYADKQPQSQQKTVQQNTTRLKPSRLAMRPLSGMPNDRQQLQPGKFSSFDWGAVEVQDDETGDGKVINWAAEKLRNKAASKKPFFLAAGFYRPHIPLYAPRRYFDLYPVDSTMVPEVPSDDLSDVGSAAIALAHSIQTAGLHKSVLQHGQWKNAVAAYLACISFVDAQIGELSDDQSWTDYGFMGHEAIESPNLD